MNIKDLPGSKVEPQPLERQLELVGNEIAPLIDFPFEQVLEIRAHLIPHGIGQTGMHDAARFSKRGELVVEQLDRAPFCAGEESTRQGHTALRLELGEELLQDRVQDGAFITPVDRIRALRFFPRPELEAEA